MAKPKLRFTEFISDWKKKRLKDIFIERIDLQKISDDAPLLSFTIEQGIINPKDKKTNRRDFLMKDKENKKFLLTEFNDIIYNPANIKFGAIHRNKLGRGVVSPIYAVFKTDENPIFMEYVVRNERFIKKSIKYLEGTVIKLMTLKPRDFLRMNIAIPSLEEQQKIADFFSKIDEKIANQEAIVSDYEEMKKGLMQKIFNQEVRFKAADGSEYPEWENSIIGKHCKMFNGDRGKNYPNSDDIVDVGIPFINAGDLENGKVNLQTAKRITREKYNSLGGAKLKKNDIVYCLRGSLGKCALVHDFDEGTVASSLVVIRAIDISPLFLYYILNSDIEYKQRIINDAGCAQPNLSAKNLGNFLIPLPHYEEQEKITKCLFIMDRKIEVEKKILEDWKELKKALLQQMFV